MPVTTGSLKSSIIIFDSKWNYQGFKTLPLYGTYTTKYVGGYFYFGSNEHFYCTDSTFNTIYGDYRSFIALYRQISYYNSQFYVASPNHHSIDVISSSFYLVKNIDMIGYNRPYGLAFLSGNMFVSYENMNQVSVLTNDVVVRNFTIDGCGNGVSITIDLFGYLPINCSVDNLIVVHDSNGNYLNKSISTLNTPYFTGIDAIGRFVVMDSNSLDIYY